MRVNGYELRAAIVRHELARDAALEQFQDSLKAFPGEEKPSPFAVMEKVRKHEEALATLQVAQADYNASVRLEIEGLSSTTSIRLSVAVKLLGGALREMKAWQEIAKGNKDKRRSYFDVDRVGTRKADTVYAVPTVSKEVAVQHATETMRRVQALRSAVAEGNARKIDLSLDPGLFE